MEESNTKKTEASSHSLNIYSKSKAYSYQCKICDAPALHSNYGVVTCYPCKMFFKRYVTIVRKEPMCNFDGQCVININTRHTCSACRLRKCFANGMQSDLIRCPLSKKTEAKSDVMGESITATSNILRALSEQNPIDWLPTTHLLQSDNPIFTVHQSTLLSNLIYTYDEQQLVSIARQFINEHDRAQTTEDISLTLAKEFFTKIYEMSGIYIRSNSDFSTLSSEDCSAFLRNIAENITCYGTTLIWNQSQIYNSQIFTNIYINIYGQNSFTMIQRILKWIDPDIILTKLALSLFAFSNHTSIFSSQRAFNTLAIVRIQNIYAEVTWKYLLHKYGYQQSIERFNRLIQCFLIATNTVSDAQNIVKHVDDITLLVEETELLFVLDDIEHIDQTKS